jgi:hypothetical protein
MNGAHPGKHSDADYGSERIDADFFMQQDLLPSSFLRRIDPR